MLSIAVFASGKGSNFLAIQKAIDGGQIRNAKIVVVISNNSDCGALEIARQYKIHAVHCSRKQFETDEDFTGALLRELEEADVNFIALAGYMKKIDPVIIRRYRNRIVNIHPALLPKYGGSGMYGIHVHEAVLQNHEPLSGATVHIVDEEYDKGPVILQRTLPVIAGDTPESLAERVLEVEHLLYPEAINLFAEGKIRLDGSHVTIMNE